MAGEAARRTVKPSLPFRRVIVIIGFSTLGPLYRRMGLFSGAPVQEIDDAFLWKSLVFRPHSHGAVEEMKEVQLAFNILMDPKKRELYIRRGRAALGDPDFGQIKGFLTPVLAATKGDEEGSRAQSK